MSLQRRTSIPCQSVHPHPLALHHPNSFAGFGKSISSQNFTGKLLRTLSFQMRVFISFMGSDYPPPLPLSQWQGIPPPPRKELRFMVCWRGLVRM